MVPSTALAASAARARVSIRTGVRPRSSMPAARKIATRLRKKTFCIDGTSPDSRTNTPISAKKNADEMMHRIPFVLSERTAVFGIVHPPLLRL